MTFVSHLSDEEYRTLGADGGRLQKAHVVARGAARVVRRSRQPDALLLVHRLLSLVPVPRRDPPARVDVYDFDDALFVGSVSAANRG